MSKEKKFLVRKESGSAKRHKHRANYADHRGAKTDFSSEDAPKFQSMRKKGSTRLDTHLIQRWLHTQVGKTFDVCYAEYLKRIQPKYLDEHRHTIFRYLNKASEVRLDGDKVYDVHPRGEMLVENRSRAFFYVHPETNIITVVRSTKRKSRW